MFFNLFNEKEQDDVSTCRRGCWSSICLVKLDVDAANLSHDEPVLEAIVFFMMPIKRIKS